MLFPHFVKKKKHRGAKLLSEREVEALAYCDAKSIYPLKLAVMNIDLPFKEFTDELNFTVIFHIVIGGGGAYTASVDYLQKMMRALNNDFEVQVWQSITTFNNFQSLAGELKKNCDKLNIKFRPFGDFDPSSNLGSQILDGIRKGYGINDYQTGAKIRLRKELNENFKDEYTKN